MRDQITLEIDSYLCTNCGKERKSKPVDYKTPIWNAILNENFKRVLYVKDWVPSINRPDEYIKRWHIGWPTLLVDDPTRKTVTTLWFRPWR